MKDFFRIDIYRQNIFVVVGENSEDFTKFVNEKFGHKHTKGENLIDISLTDFSACCMSATDKKDGTRFNTLVFEELEVDIGTVVHECSHLVDNICENISMPLTEDTTEPRAYLMEKVVEEVIVLLRKHKDMACKKRKPKKK